MFKKPLAICLTFLSIYVFCTDLAWACNDVLCNVSELDKYLKEKLLYPMMILTAGVALTIAVVQKDGAENSQSDPDANNRARKGRLKVLSLVVIGALTKSALSLLGAADGWGDAILAFNSALAGVYAGQGWISKTNH